MNFLEVMRLVAARRTSALAGNVRYICKYFIIIGLCAVTTPGILHAENSDEVFSDTSWGYWFRNQISLHPDVVAAREKMNAALSTAESLERPLYNPELDTEYEREGRDNNYRLGLSQTIDWWDKRGTQKQQAIYGRTAARRSFNLVVQQKSAEALQALVIWNASRQGSTLALQQEQQLTTLLDLIKARQQSGDLGEIDMELAFLSLSQKLNDAAQAQARFKQAEARLQELLPDWSAAWARIPDNLWTIGEKKDVDQMVDEHSAVAAARADWEVMKQSAQLSRLKGKAEPTVGLNAGKSSGDTVVGVTLSIPLNVRNNFSAEARAASQEALAAEAGYRSIRRKQQAAIRASTATLNEYRKRYQRWHSLMQGRGENSAILLEKQWRSGDMSTTEYLLALQQRTEGLIAGIELHTKLQLARVDWLLQTGQMQTALMQVKR